MSYPRRERRPMCRQSGQVLAEAVVVMLLLVVLLGAVHLTGRWQFQWATQWLRAQIAADAVALDHAQPPTGSEVRLADHSRWRNWVMRDYAVGQPKWQSISTPGRFAQTAWRLSAAGQASLDRTVTARMKAAPILWRGTELASKAVVHTLMPTIKAVEAPWDDRGSALQWLDQWQGSTPSHYLNRTR